MIYLNNKQQEQIFKIIDENPDNSIGKMVTITIDGKIIAERVIEKLKGEK